MKVHVQLDNENREAKVVIKLSERNLLTMLSKLASESSKTIMNSDIEGGWNGIVVLQAECDCVHYANREAGNVREEDETYVELMQLGESIDPNVEIPKDKPCGCS